MNTNNTLQAPATYQQRIQLLLQGLGEVGNMVRRGKTMNGEISELRELLDSLPLARGPYAVACRRLANADRYLANSETGAARYELRLLAGSLHDLDATYSPRELA